MLGNINNESGDLMKVLITGASSGIGKSMAYIFASKGYDLVLVARSEEKLKNIKKEIDYVKVDICVSDLSLSENCINIHNKYKDIDILVNNAGFGLVGVFEKTDLNKELKMIDTNIRALHILTKLYLRDMIDRDSGKILNVASISGFLPGPLMDTYYATKNYVVRLSEGIREELRRKKSNVSISVLCPGPVNTNFDKVAEVDFSLDALSSDYVADYAIKGLERNKFYIVPGFSIKMLKIFSKIIPTNMLARMVYLSQKRKKDV